MDWRHDAACRDEDPELFFPIGNFGPALIQIEEAKSVCRRCPVSSACLQWALESGQDGGVWGGTSEESAVRSANAVQADARWPAATSAASAKVRPVAMLSTAPRCVGEKPTQEPLCGLSAALRCTILSAAP